MGYIYDLYIYKREMQQALINILNNTHINHRQEILKCDSLKTALCYCKIHSLSGQVTGPLIERYIIYKYDLIKNNSSDCIGDIKYNNKDIELKISVGGQTHSHFNFVQIRLNHVCDYILIAYHISLENVDMLGDMYIFHLSKDDMIKLICDYGTYAHGTIAKLGSITHHSLKTGQLNNSPTEYALRPKFGDKCWKALMHFRKEDII